MRPSAGDRRGGPAERGGRARREGTETIGDGDGVESGELRIEAKHTPGHCADHLALLFNDSDASPPTSSSRGPWEDPRAGGDRLRGPEVIGDAG